jgi:hypothetical protein
VPTLQNALEQIQFKIKKFGPNAHCGRLVVMEEVREKAIKNEPDEEGRRRTRIGLQTYSPESYSAWANTLEYLLSRCGYNPILALDVILLLVQEARQHTEGEGTDGIDIAKAGLFAVCDYEEKLRAAKLEYRTRRSKK